MFKPLRVQAAGDPFRQFLPDLPAGRYALYGDIVHANGIGETVATMRAAMQVVLHETRKRITIRM